MPKGQKTCQKCGQSTGPRCKECPKCGTPFVFKNIIIKIKQNTTTKQTTITKIFHKVKHHKEEKIDWRLLQPQDEIKIVSGGPYYVANKTKVFMGYKGKFKIKHIDQEGICAYPLGHNRDSGMCHIYMNGKKIGKSGMIMRVHKIRKLAVKTK